MTKENASHGNGVAVTPLVKLLYTPVEAAQVLAISRSSLYVLLAKGVLTSVHVGGSRRITTDALYAYVESLNDETSDGAARYDQVSRSRHRD
jgi:excisionase family DNA binding protein